MLPEAFAFRSDTSNETRVIGGPSQCTGDDRFALFATENTSDFERLHCEIMIQNEPWMLVVEASYDK